VVASRTGRKIERVGGGKGLRYLPIPAASRRAGLLGKERGGILGSVRRTVKGGLDEDWERRKTMSVRPNVIIAPLAGRGSSKVVFLMGRRKKEGEGARKG